MNQIYSQKNNKVELPFHVYETNIHEKRYVLVRLEAQSWGRMGNTNDWDVFYGYGEGCDGTIVHITDGGHQYYHQDNPMTRYEGIDGYFDVKITIDTPIGIESEKFSVDWKGVSFRKLDEFHFSCLISALNEAQEETFGTHGRFLHLDFLKEENEIEIACKKILRCSWGLQIKKNSHEGKEFFRWGESFGLQDSLVRDYQIEEKLKNIHVLLRKVENTTDTWIVEQV